MEPTLRPVTADEFERWEHVGEIPFGERPSEWGIETHRQTIPLDRTIAAFDGDEMVAATGAYPLSFTVPGNSIPVGGVSMVGVVPTHRRRGVLTQMMRYQLEDLRSRGEGLGVLWASESLIYPRFGYGLASWHGSIDIESERARFVDDPGPAGRYRMLELKEAAKVVAPIHQEVAERTPGMFARTPAWWARRNLADPPEWQRGWGPKWCAVWEHEGEARAYTTYRVKNRWEDGFPSGRVQVVDALSTSVEGYREIWRYLFGLDLTTRVEAHFLPVDHPLLFMLDQPDRLRFRLGAALWVRVVDVRVALEGRRYPRDGALTVGVDDPFCPWNQGRWLISVTDGNATVERTEGEADLSLGAVELGMIYLGGMRVSELARAGRIRGEERAVEPADAMFGWHVAPWCPEIF